MSLLSFFKRKPKNEEDAAPAGKDLPPADITRYLWRFLWRRKWILMFITILGIALTAFGTYVCTPLYRASTKILVKSSETEDVVLFDNAYRPMLKRGMNIIPANNIIELATSQTLARDIVDEFKLDAELKRRKESPDGFREEFWVFVGKVKQQLKGVVKYPYVLYRTRIEGLPPPPESIPDYRLAAVRSFMSDVAEIELVADSDVVKLTVWWSEPVLAEAMAIRLTDLLVQHFVELQQSAARRGYDFCSGELAKAGDELATVQQDIKAFKEQWNIRHLDSEKNVKIEELHEVERNLITATAELAGMQARLTAEEQKVKDEGEKLTSLSSYQDLLDEMRTRSFEITALRAKQEQYEAAKLRIESRLAGLTSREPELRDLERELDLKERLFVQLGQKQEELAIQRVSDLSGLNIRIIDTPELPATAGADWPDWMLNMCIGIVGSLLVAIGVALLVHFSKEPLWSVVPDTAVRGE